MTYTAAEMREMVDLLEQHAVQATHAADMRDYRIAAAMLRQAAEAMDAKLPCDVKLPPGTVILRGVGVGTLMLAIKQREHLPEFCQKFAATTKEGE